VQRHPLRLPLESRYREVKVNARADLSCDTQLTTV